MRHRFMGIRRVAAKASQIATGDYGEPLSVTSRVDNCYIAFAKNFFRLLFFKSPTPLFQRGTFKAIPWSPL